MTDLISSLADSIVALINTKPRSPTKAEIEEVLQHYLFVMDAGTALYKLPGRRCEAPDPTELNEASLLRAMVAINGVRDEAQLKADCQDEALVWINDPTLLASQPSVPANYKQPTSVSQAMLDAKDAIRKSAYEPGRYQHMLPCQSPDHPDGQHNWHAYDQQGLFCEPGAPWDVSNGARMCICGARKP